MFTFMENQPLLWHLKAWWTDGWMNKQTEKNLDTLDWYLTLYQILTKSIILLGKYELFKYFNIKVMTQKLKVCFVDLKVMGMGNDNQ